MIHTFQNKGLSWFDKRIEKNY